MVSAIALLDHYAEMGFNARTEIGPTDSDKFVRIRVKVHGSDVYRVKTME
jgi:hypothetical protein